MHPREDGHPPDVSKHGGAAALLPEYMGRGEGMGAEISPALGILRRETGLVIERGMLGMQS